MRPVKLLVNGQDFIIIIYEVLDFQGDHRKTYGFLSLYNNRLFNRNIR